MKFLFLIGFLISTAAGAVLREEIEQKEDPVVVYAQPMKDDIADSVTKNDGNEEKREDSAEDDEPAMSRTDEGAESDENRNKTLNEMMNDDEEAVRDADLDESDEKNGTVRAEPMAEPEAEPEPEPKKEPQAPAVSKARFFLGFRRKETEDGTKEEEPESLGLGQRIVQTIEKVIDVLEAEASNITAKNDTAELDTDRAVETGANSTLNSTEEAAAREEVEPEASEIQEARVQTASEDPNNQTTSEPKPKEEIPRNQSSSEVEDDKETAATEPANDESKKEDQEARESKAHSIVQRADATYQLEPGQATVNVKMGNGLQARMRIDAATLPQSGSYSLLQNEGTQYKKVKFHFDGSGRYEEREVLTTEAVVAPNSTASTGRISFVVDLPNFSFVVFTDETHGQGKKQ